MAYIPKEDDNEESGMDILAPQSNATQQNNQPQAQNQDLNVSGAQSATVGNTNTQTAPKAPSGASKKASSGMFTNIQKYINQNKAGAQNMSQNIQKNTGMQNQNVQNAISKQKNDFMSRVESNRNRIQGAQNFGQQTIQQAQIQESTPMLQQQQSDTQQRYDQFNPNLTDQTANINQNKQNQATEQIAYDQSQQAYNQAQQNFNQQAQNFGQQLNQPVQSGEQMTYNRFQEGVRVTPTYFDNEQVQQGLASGDQNMIQAVDQSLQQDQTRVNQINEQLQLGTGNPGLIDELNTLTGRLDSFQQYRQSLNAQQEAQGQNQTQRGKLDQLQDEYNRAQEQQRLFQNKNQLQTEMAAIQEKIDNASQELTQDDIQRFNDLRTGVERFDDAILNLTTQQRESDELSSSAELSNTSEGRRNLLRQNFGQQGGYTSGQATLDNLILSGNKEASSSLVQGLRDQAQNTQRMLKDAFEQGRISQDELRLGTENLQKELQQGLDTANETLQQDLESRVQSGEGSYIKELQDKLQSGQGLSAQDREILGITGEERYNLDPATLLNEYDPTQYSIQDVANLTDVARAQALARLSGKDNQEMFLNENEIMARQLRGEGQEQTTTLGELSNNDRNSVMQFKDKLRSGQQFENLDQARNEIKSSLQQQDPDVGIISSNIQQLVEKGFTGTNHTDVNLEDVVNGDPNAIGLLRDAVYWNHVGQNGRHGVSVSADRIRNAVISALEKTQAANEMFSAGNSNALRGESESSFVQSDAAKTTLGQ